MLVTLQTKSILRLRKTERAWTREGFECVGEGGGKLWELHRGGRTDCEIKDARVSPNGRDLWIRITKRKIA